MDTSALSLFFARSALSRLSLNQSNFTSTQTTIELILTTINRAQARYAAQNPDNYNTPGELPETLEYLALYVFGLLKTPLLAPYLQVPSNSSYLD